jgi:DNA-binding protein HU-beta
MIDIDWDARSRKRAVLELFSMVTWCGARNARGLLHSGLKQQEDRENQRRAMANQRMTQTQLVKVLAAGCQVSNKDAKGFLEELAKLAIGEVKKNGVFVLPGIGRLVRVDRKARTGRNPATGEAIKIPAKKVVKFRVAKAAKDAIVPPKKK